MLNFIEGRAPLWLYLIYFSVYLIVCFYGLIYIRKNKMFHDRRKYPTIFFIVFFCIFAVFYCINSDYFNYRDWVYGNFQETSNSGEEIVYTYLAHYVRGNYELFRLIIWGGAICITALYTRILKLPVLTTLFIWFILYFNKICYARASLAMAIYFFGLAIYSSQKRREYKFIGIVIAIFSILFHREMIVGVMVLPIVFFRMNKHIFTFYTFFAIIGTLLVNPDMFVFDDIEMMEEYNEKITTQTESIQSGKYIRESIKNVLSACWNYSTIYIPFIVASRKILVNKKKIPFYINTLYSATFGIILIATCLWFKLGFGNLFFYRVLFIVTSSVTILLVYCYRERLISNKTIIKILLWTITYHILYRYTNLTAHGDL